MFEIAVIGAGVAGLTCARRLQQAGKRVVLLDKSRGLGGRLATRRLAGTHADHGVCYLQPKGDLFREWIEELVDIGILRVWSEGIHRLSADGILQPPTKFAPCYAAPMGATSIAKYLGKDLEIIGDKLITAIDPTDNGNGWRLSSSDPQWSLTAEQVVVATPPAQALAIVGETILQRRGYANDTDCFQQMSSVNFTRSIVAISVYPATQQNVAAAIPWQGIQCIDHPILAWIGLDSSKQIEPTQPVLVVQSSATFAEEHFDAPDLAVIGQKLLDVVAPLAPGLNAPALVQVHRWGYAFARNPLPDRFLTAQTPAPLYFCGDCCGGNRVESAYLSGVALANRILNLT
ncbi:FAD-dependent oxidoreductase [Chamaesiphon sp. VAR_48_metabat_135_sub]|uniref:NAD(P)/FAD-dependent oxidoreductase n=1 Tax=Chamaesiphon sp. VAR_48_metabat_135_sub TaxID=2964699 RepID=UPI00286C2D95|nr:FAD-dependent oxidoreductase [Chamaesiphon sp. VAR_48_metabat_135_sub]